MGRMRLFLDANVLFLAGYSSDSPVHDLLALARAGRCELVASAYAVEEASRNLVAKGPANAVGALEQALTLIALVHEAPQRFVDQISAPVLSDPTDVPILMAAVYCSADILVTGDRRAFGRYFRRRIMGTEVLVLRDALRRVLGLPLAEA